MFENMFWDDYSYWKNSATYVLRRTYIYAFHVVDSDEERDIADLMCYFLFKTVLP